MVIRQLQKKLIYLSKKFPVISLTGPRQSGKSTLVRNAFPKLPYISLENTDHQSFALKDPRTFLHKLSEGAIIDEAQKAPHLFSYMQHVVDEREKSGQFILTGSQNFLLLEKITQSLAGRVAILKLLPFSMGEMKTGHYMYKTFDEYVFNGFYPRLHNKKINPVDFYPSYIQTYIERDVRQIKNISDLGAFTTFIKMCAGRTGQLLNISSLSIDCGMSVNSVKSWLSILEASYIIYFLQPHHKNFTKRMVKMPKLYFYDTGLACSLLGIENYRQLHSHYSRGALFENFILNELLKFRFNQGKTANYYFWRDKLGKEIDCIVEQADQLIPIEIKSGKTMQEEFFNGINYWNKLSGNNPKNSYLVYGGDTSMSWQKKNLVSWKEIETNLLKKLR